MRVSFLKDANRIEIVVKTNRVVMAADDVELADMVSVTLCHILEELVHGHRVGAFLAWVPPIATEGTMSFTDVSRVDIEILDEVNILAILLEINLVSQHTDR